MITLATLEQATAQEVFDQVAEHLLTQNEQSVQDPSQISPRCLYRSPTGLKCAAGALMSDEEYKRGMDTLGDWSALVEHKMVPKKHGDLIQDLQTIHDGFQPTNWKTSLNTLAKIYNLIFKF